MAPLPSAIYDLTTDIEPLEIPDDDDIEIISVRPSLHHTQISSSDFRNGGGYPKPGYPSLSWIELPQYSNLHVGDVMRTHIVGDYIQITKIFLHRTCQDLVAIHGFRYRKMSRMPGGFLCPQNEMVMIQEIYTDSIPDAQSMYHELLLPADLTAHSQRTVRLTNMLLKSGLTEGQLGQDRDGHTKQHNRIYTCRSMYCSLYNGVYGSRNLRKIEENWQNITAPQADPDLRVPDRIYRQFRHRIHMRHRIDNVVHVNAAGLSLRRSIYSALDGFCGGGFGTEGAKMAKLQVVWAFDHDPHAMRTYRRNNRNVKTLLMDFKDVLDRHGEKIKVDVLMLSFPCQYFSTAHTRPGRNDDANEVAMLGLGEILKKLVPRLVVIEQAFGMDRIGFRQHLMAVIAGFRDLDYSVRKGVLNFAGLGLSGTRRRLIFIGAAPGEALPPFPRPTYNTSAQQRDSALKDCVTVADALAGVQAGHPDHNFHDLPSRIAPYDPRSQQLGTLTCSRSLRNRSSVHWNGTRYWTVHELCLLQSAPPTFRMGRRLGIGAQIRQVGNAFPSVAAAAIYKECVKSLRETDEDDDLMDAVAASSSSSSSSPSSSSSSSSSSYAVAQSALSFDDEEVCIISRREFT